MESFEIFSSARLRDFPVLLASVRRGMKLWGPSKYVVAVPSGDRKAVQAGLGAGVSVVDENELLVGFDRDEFQRRPIPYFPRSFGWYLQQFLKIEYCRRSAAEHCLVWDADTIPLEALDFMDGSGRIFLTRASEFHRPYFYTIEKLFGRKALAATSFISQHMFVKNEAMRAMCRRIEGEHRVEHWTEALGDILETHPEQANLFSEYETYANYMLMYEPESVVERDVKWGRFESKSAWGVPKRQLKTAEAERLSFAAYESKDAVWSRAMLKSLESAPQLVKRLAVTFVLLRSGA